ncbi:MAG: hypothetical protein C4583_18485 [Anaerolineaceae bacterium]|nr:MAG: hypothetical protein C4583_18485 [Anaerolineaceae bacterium]
MTRRILIPSLILLAILAFAVSSAAASSLTDNGAPSHEAILVPGNYCISCHQADDPRLASVTEWKGAIGRDVNSPCPAATTIHEELVYTERLMLMIDRSQQSVGALTEKSQARLDGYTQRYSRILDAPVTSLDAFVSEAQTTRYQLNKIYTALNDLADTTKKQTVLIYAVLVTLVVLGSLAWGLYNTRMVKSGSGKRKSGLTSVLIILIVLGLFTLPIFRVPAAEVTVTTVEQQEAQAVLDTADRAATTSDRAQARAWMLARLAAKWNATDPAQAQAILDESLAALAQVDGNDTALWGQSLAVQEAMIGVPIDMEKADLVAVDVNAARARLWSLPLIAIEWNAVDPVRAAVLLQSEQDRIESETGIYRDLQMRGVALAWNEIQPSNAVTAARSIEDASIRVWTLRELGKFDLAADAARQVSDPVQRARALREVAAASGDKQLFDEALSALDGVSGESLAYALSDLAAASGDASLVGKIDAAYPEAKTAALLYLGEFQSAWDASLAIADPYEQARAQAAIAAAWENAEAATQIQAPLYRDLALRDVIRKSGNASLVDSIQSPYYRVQALTALGEYAAAAELAGQLVNSYPLMELAAALAKTDPQSALALVDEMSSEADKAGALRALATKDPSLFEQAQGMALAARVQGDALAPSVALTNLADAFWTINLSDAESALRQAYEAVLRIAVK